MSILEKTNLFWNAENPTGFFSINTRLAEIESKIYSEKESTLLELSSAVRRTDAPLANKVAKKWEEFKELLNTVDNIALEFQVPYQLAIDITVEPSTRDAELERKATDEEKNAQTILNGNIRTFTTMVERIRVRIQKVYNETLYPLFLIIKNADRGSDPNGILNQIKATFFKGPANPQLEMKSYLNLI